MKKFDIAFTIRGPGGTDTVPNSVNPVECESMEEVLKILSENLPRGGFMDQVEIIGVTIKEVE